MYTKLAECQTLKFEFCNCTSLIVTFRTIISTFTKTKLEVELRKINTYYISILMCVDRQRSAKLVAVGRTRHEQLTHAWSYACCSSFATRSTLPAVCTVFSLLLPVLIFVKNCADPVTVHIHEYVYISILLSSTFT